MDQQPPTPPMPNTPPSQPITVTPPPIQQPTTSVPTPVTPQPTEPMQPPSPSASSATPAQLPPHNPKKVMMIVIAVIIIIVIGAAAFFFMMKKPTPAAKTTNPVVVKSAPTPTPDPTANWLTYITKDYSFIYPSDWTTTKTDYLNSVEVLNKNKSVGITISDGQYPYGFGGQVKEESKNLLVSVDGQEYNVKEKIINNKEAFTDFKLNSPAKQHILFGTGYPAVRSGSTNASLTDYENDKNTIIQILSSFKFTNATPSATPSVSPSQASISAQPAR